MIYLDNNATTGVDPLVREAMLSYLTECYGNPSSMHRFGQEARQAIEEARRRVADLLGCEPRELIFSSGGTESDNAAILGLLASRPDRKTIITSSVEHSAVRAPLHQLARTGYRIVEIPVDTAGHLEMPTLTAAMKEPDVALATIMWANNETGVIFDVAAVAAAAKASSVPLHVDAVQAVGKLPIDLRGVHAGIDLLSLSAHKLHGPKGVGALFIRRTTRWTPLLRGGPQERERRGGTENVAGIVGLGAAATLAQQALADGQSWPRVAALRDRLEAGVLATIPETYINGDRSARTPNTTNIGFAGLEAEAILLLLSEQDICASAGAACASGSLEPSPVLQAMRLPERVAHGAIRFSLSRRSTSQEIDETLAILPGIIERLRAVMPVAHA